MKYGKKTKGAVPVYGPDAKDAKLKPVKPVGPGQKIDEVDMTNSSAKVINNDGKTITFAMPDGTQIQKPITPDTLATDKTGKPVVNMVPTAGTAPTMGAAQPQSPEEIFAKGKDITVNTGQAIEEVGEQPVGGMAPAAPGEKPAPEAGEPARPPALPAGQTFDPTVNDGGTAYRPGEAEWAEKYAAQGNLKRAAALNNVDLNKSSYDPETGVRVTVTPGKTAPISERKFKEALDAMLTIAGLR